MVSWELALEPNSRSVQAGRKLIRRLLGGLEEARIETAALLTDELVSNAVLHGGPPFTLAVNRENRTLHVAVTDSGPGRPRLRPTPHDAEHGRGLIIVDVLSDQWGVDELPGRKRVWFRMGVGELGGRDRGELARPG